MSSDLLVALPKATPDAVTLFAVNCNRRHGEGVSLALVPGRDHAPDETAPAHLAEARHTWGVLACRAAGVRGYLYGLNEKGVAIGCTTIATRLVAEGMTLTGPDLVRLGLERGSCAYSAVEILTDLITRHGQGGGSTAQTLDCALLIADATEAYVLEAAGPHWAMTQVGSVRAVSSACMLRQDWDRISRGLSDLAIRRGWWPEDGCKLDFARALGRVSPDQAGVMRRWGRATLALEQHTGHVDLPMLRALLREQSDLLDDDIQTAASFVARLGPAVDDLPVAWIAFGPPATSVYLPIFPVADLPDGFGDSSGQSRLGRDLATMSKEPGFRAALAGAQQRLDEHAHDFIPEARTLHRRGAKDELRRLGGSFMACCVDCVNEALRSLHARSAEAVATEELVMQGADF